MNSASQVENVTGFGVGPRLIQLSRLMVYASALLIVALVALISLDVFSRSLFNQPLRGVPELVSLSMPAIVFLALGHLFIKNKLIRADLLLTLLAKRSAAIADLLQCLYYCIGAAVMLCIALPAIQALNYAITTNEFLGVEGDFTVRGCVKRAVR